jgi:membrane associated rhomboid family serine protease
MRRVGASPFSFPEFRGATRRLVLLNLCAYFALLLAESAFPHPAVAFDDRFGFIPSAFLHGRVWQPLTYSFIHPGIFGTLFELLSLWLLAGFLESLHTSSWVTGLYATSVLGAAAAATAIYAASGALGYSLSGDFLYGCGGGIFGLLVAIGLLYGDMEFLLFFTIGIKARYLAALYALVSIAMRPLRCGAGRRDGEGDGFAHDVVEAADPGDRALDAHAEAAVRDAAVAAQVQVPLEGFLGQLMLSMRLFSSS